MNLWAAGSYHSGDMAVGILVYLELKNQSFHFFPRCRFVFVLLGPKTDNSKRKYHEIGRSVGTLMSDEVSVGSMIIFSLLFSYSCHTHFHTQRIMARVHRHHTLCGAYAL